MTTTYHGVIVPMATPFTIDKRVDETALAGLTEWIIAQGAVPFVFGTTGESASIPDGLRSSTVELVAKTSQGKCPVYAGISSNCLQGTVETAKLYLDLGADVLVAHLPSYYDLTADQMLLYYERLAEQVNAPLMLYNIRSTTHMSIPLEVAERLSHHPNIVGLKDSERDQERLEKAIAMWRSRLDFSHFVGWGAQLGHGMLSGSSGIVPSTGNVAPALCRQLYDAAVAGDSEKVQSLQLRHNAISEIYQSGRTLGQSLAALKMMMDVLGLCQPHVLPPLTPLPREQREPIAAAMRNLGLV